MINIGKRNLKLLCMVLCVSVCFLLTGCGKSSTNADNFSLDINGLTLNFDGNVKFEKVGLKTDDLDEIVDLYQEVGNNLEYRDSLLVAERYAQGVGANVFVQDNLNSLEDQGLTLSNIKKTQIGLKKNGENIYAVLVEYEITEGLVSDLPLLYVSQIFIPKDNDMVLMSYITESKSSRSHASDMFKNIK